MALNRNFRTTYYKTLGVPVVQHIVDAEASYAALLAEPVVNRTQVAKLAQEIGIPAQYRDVVWQLLSGVLPPHTSIWEFALRERTYMYEDVRDAAQALQTATRSIESVSAVAADVSPSSFSSAVAALPDSDSEDCEMAHTQSQVISATAVAHLVALHRTYWLDILLHAPLQGMEDAVYLERVARAVLEVVCGDAEQFWCFTKLLELFSDNIGLIKAGMSLQSFYDAESTSDLEALFIRIVEALKKD